MALAIRWQRVGRRGILHQLKHAAYRQYADQSKNKLCGKSSFPLRGAHQMRLFAPILTIAAIALSQSAVADDNPQLSAEFQILDRFVGTWDMDLTVKPAGGDAINVKKAETRSWSPGRTVVRFEDAKVAGDKEAPIGGPEFQMLLTYDANTKTFRGVMMYGAGRSLIMGTWDEATSTMTFNGTSPDDGSTFVFKNRFVDADHSESTGTVKNAKGEVVQEQAYKQTRRKK